MTSVNLGPRCMPRLRHLLHVLIATVGMAAAGYAHAIIIPCSLTYIETVPAHPGPTDPVRFRLQWPPPWVAVGSQLLARTSVTGNQINLDLAFADTAEPIAGFTHIGSMAGDTYPNANLDAESPVIGPLAPGRYPIHFQAGFPSSAGEFESWCFRDGLSVEVTPQSAPNLTSPVVEFYNASLDHYFMTQNFGELAVLDAGIHAGWSRTGQSFLAYLPGQSDARGRPTCRWYASPANLDTHFFSASYNECRKMTDLFSGTWTHETDDAFEIALPDLITGQCASGTVPVYRLWNGRADSNHRYTTDLATRAMMVAKGYRPEGYGPDAVAMCAVK